MRRKLNAMPAVFEGRSVLLVDDSIVRGTTMSQIVDMVRQAGATKVRGSGFGVWGSGCEVWGLGFGVQGVGSRIQGCRCPAAAQTTPAPWPVAGGWAAHGRVLAAACG